MQAIRTVRPVCSRSTSVSCCHADSGAPSGMTTSVKATNRPVASWRAAVVTDVGGVLSHSAIVAREFDLPAVVGTQVGTVVITSGQTLTVDGTKGRVYLDGRA